MLLQTFMDVSLRFGSLLVALTLSVAACAAEAVTQDESGETESGLLGFEHAAAAFDKRLTRADLDTAKRWAVGGTDLGIPYVLENGSIGYLFGDTFSDPLPGGKGWRSPVMLRSAVSPAAGGGVVFDSAAKTGGGFAPELIANAHDTRGLWSPKSEWSVIPNDGISFPETKRQVISFMSMNRWDGNGSVRAASFRSGYAGLAYSDNGNDFTRVPATWQNDEGNNDADQMWTMQRDADWVYIFSVRSGRQDGPMMLRRVDYRKILEPGAYQGWGNDGTGWAWGKPPTPILQGKFGEPSVRRLKDGTWAMAYLDAAAGNIVTRTAKGPDQLWSAERVQVTFAQEPCLYGGFIHPWSTLGAGGLHIMVSKWVGGGCSPPVRPRRIT